MSKIKRKSKVGPIEIFIESIILILFIRPMFTINYLTGIFYLLAIGFALWKKILFRKKNVAWMIIMGTFLSYFAGLFIPYILGSYLAGDIVSAIIIFIIFFLIWRKSRRLIRGK